MRNTLDTALSEVYLKWFPCPYLRAYVCIVLLLRSFGIILDPLAVQQLTNHQNHVDLSWKYMILRLLVLVQ